MNCTLKYRETEYPVDEVRLPVGWTLERVLKVSD